MLRPRSAILALCAAAACTKPAPRGAKLAVIAPLSGIFSAEGQGVARAAALALEEAAAEGSLPRPVELLVLDDRGDPEAATAAARQAAADPQVFAVVGPMNSACAVAAARALAPEGLAMLTPATESSITRQQEEAGWPGARVAFQMTPANDWQGEWSSDYARHRLGLKSFVVLDDGGVYGQGLAAGFAEGLAKRGGRVLFKETVPSEPEARADAARRACAAEPDGVFFGGMFMDTGLFLKEARLAGCGGTLMGGGGARSPELFRYAGEAADGVYLSMSGMLLDSLPAAEGFLAAYARRFGGAKPRLVDHYAYDGVRIALWAMRKTKGDRKAAPAAIRSESHETLMGTLLFDAKGASVRSRVSMTRADAKAQGFSPAY